MKLKGLGLCFYLCGVMIVFITTSSFSQSIQFQNFSTSDGLSSTQIYDLFQDEDGVIWFASDNGLTSFNSVRFRQFNKSDGLPDNTIFKFLPQADGNIWCITQDNKLFYFRSGSVDFTLYKHNNLLESEKNRIPCGLVVHHNGTIDVSFVNRIGKLSISGNGRLLEKPINNAKDVDQIFGMELPKGNFDQLPILRYRSQLDLSKERFVETGYTSRYNYFQKGNSEFVGADNRLIVLRNGKELKSLKFDNEIISIGSYGDDIYVGFKAEGFRVFNQYGEIIDHQLKPYSITDVMFDHEGGLWASTLTKGVFYAHSPRVKRIESFGDQYVQSLSKDKNGSLFVSTYAGRLGLLEGGLYNVLDNTPSHSYALCEYNSVLGGMLTNSKDGDLELLDASGKVVKSFGRADFVTSFSEDAGSILITQKHSRLLRIKNGKIDMIRVPESIYDAVEFNDKYLLGTLNGIYYFDPLNGKTNLYAEKSKRVRVTDLDIHGGQVYTATTEDGVLIFEDGKLIYEVNESNGLLSNYINEVYVENETTIWACTNKGLSKINLLGGGKVDVISFSTMEGLYDNKVNDIEIIGGKLYIGTSSGLFVMNQEDFIKRKETELFLKVTNSRVNNENQSDFLHLSHDQNKLEFQTQAISFKYREYLKYRYKLIGLNSDWIETSDPNITFAGLAPGAYELIVEAGTPMGWSERSIHKKIHISPPFYKSIGFIVSVILSIGLIIWLFFKYRILIYNKSVVKEILRYFKKRTRRKECSFVVRSQGRDVKINSSDVLFIKSLGNYIEIHTKQKKVVVRERISKILDEIPDKLEYSRIQRSYIIRLDAVTEKGVDVVLVGDYEIKVGEKYKKELERIHL